MDCGLLRKDDKNMLENIGNLFVKCMRHITKGYLSPLLGISDYQITMYCLGREPS